MGYNPLINRVDWGYNPLILTIDPNFQRDILGPTLAYAKTVSTPFHGLKTRFPGLKKKESNDKAHGSYDPSTQMIVPHHFQTHPTQTNQATTTTTTTTNHPPPRPRST